MPPTAILLAAGRGTRMGGALPKPLVPVCGRPILRHLTDALTEAGVKDIVLVVGHRSDEVRRAMGERFRYVVQRPQRGTAQAVALARDLTRGAAEVLVLVGDSPLLRPVELRALIDTHRARGAACSFLTADFPAPPPYARVLRGAEGNVTGCVEERDASPAQRAIRELLTSHFCFDAAALWAALPTLRPSEKTGETYLTDIIPALLTRGGRVEAVRVDDWRRLVGLNTPADVNWAEGILCG